jgi:hypothetical protein
VSWLKGEAVVCKTLSGEELAQIRTAPLATVLRALAAVVRATP